MTVLNLKKYYSHFLNGHGDLIHAAAHSHHFWPDVTREAQLQYWDDCAKISDQKWGKVFGEVIPKTQSHLADLMNFKNPEQIALAPNTHELLVRLLSLYIEQGKLHILTTRNEFYSWKRQIDRLMELPQVKVSFIDTDQLEKSFSELISPEIDLVFISQVFFNSGRAITDETFKKLVNLTPAKTRFVIDGYHGFAALPSDLSSLEGRIFYLGGGYKYAQGGEGIGFCFLPNETMRPTYTGWFAEFGELEKAKPHQVSYAKSGIGFMGATQDPSGFYRFNATWDLFKAEGITLTMIHEHVRSLQKLFIEELPLIWSKQLGLLPLFDDLNWHGHFLTFKARDNNSAELIEKKIKAENIFIDRRVENIRFGFGLYHNEQDIKNLVIRLKNISL